MPEQTQPRAPWHHEQGEATGEVERLIRGARAAFDDAHVPVSQSKLSRLIRREVRRRGERDAQRAVYAYLDASPSDRGDFGAWLDAGYVDRTGSRAVANVMARAGGVGG